jgi:hypothetical protein|tara:strand:+ start:39 stop:299 length:261 start_codon:yes stop_codon:yes gene_type:complete
MNTNVVIGIPIIIPEYITEVDENDELISEIVLPECFEGNIISGWSDTEGNEGVFINGLFDDNQDTTDFFDNEPELRNIITRYFNGE